MPEQAYVVVVISGADPVRLRAVIEREGWQMPLAPFVAGKREVTLVEVMAKAKKARGG